MNLLGLGLEFRSSSGFYLEYRADSKRNKAKAKRDITYGGLLQQWYSVDTGCSALLCQ